MRLLSIEGNRMPKRGKKTITVKTGVYDYFFNKWLKEKEEYTITHGIQRFSAYLTYRLGPLISQDTNQKSKTSQSTTLNKP
jgi:hypothetical protein